MNFKTLLKSLVFMLLLFGCSSQNEPLIDLKPALIQAFINSPEAQSSKKYGKVIVLKTAYCKSFDCEEYFRDYKDEIQFYTKGDAFRRAIRNYLEIENIDDEKGYIILNNRTKGIVEEIKIKI